MVLELNEFAMWLSFLDEHEIRHAAVKYKSCRIILLCRIKKKKKKKNR